MNYKSIVVLLFSLFCSNLFFGQAYVKFNQDPPKQILRKSSVIENIEIKYNIPKSGYMYVALLRNDIPIGNTIVPVKRGKRVVLCNIYIWEDKTLKLKGDYKYVINIWEGEKDSFQTRILDPVEYGGVEVVKK